MNQTVQQPGRSGTETWISSRLDYLRALKAPTVTQKLLVQLADKPERSKQEQRELDALIRLERINERAAQAKVKAHKIIRDKSESDRKERNHRLIMQGALIDLAGLHNVDRGVLLGSLLQVAQQLRSESASSVEAMFKAQGDAMLARHV